MRRRSLIPVALVAVVVAIVVLTRDGGGHRVSFIVPSATGLLSGFDVRESGQAVGTVASVDLLDDYRVRVVLKIDDAAWPLPAGTRFKLRQGGTIHYSDRYVEVLRHGTTPMRDNAQLPASAFINAVEYDDLFKVFDGATRSHVRSLIRRLSEAAPKLRQILPGALRKGAPAATSTAALLRELGDDPRALDVLVRSASGIARAAASADPGLGTLVDGAGQTFAAVGRRSRELQRMLAATPATLRTARATAASVDTALLAARELTDRLHPAVGPLRDLGRPVTSLLGTVDRVGPSATLTLSTLGTAAPGLTRFLDKAADPALPLVQRVATQADPQVGCIRPFSPEIAGLATNWATLWGAVGDDHDAYFRAQVGLVPYPNEIPVDSGTVSKALPAGALRMAFPRPPGQLVNKPWFQPQCGITKDALDASKDPEAQAFDPLSKKIIDLGGQ